ncbi:MAG TPA: peroxiredoxin-like family protein [Phnomibacter sp.]|nr:peroxiredoxin-like family protein [Phnomibacter sp.]
MKRIALLFLFVWMMCQFATAQKATLHVGDIAPYFSGSDQKGHRFDSKEQLQKSKLLVVFYRGHWCPYCNRELSSIQDSLQMLHAKNVRVVAITPEQPAYVQKTIEKTDVKFPVLHDKGHSIMDNFGVTTYLDAAAINRLKTIGVDIATINGSNGAVLPLPAVFILSQQGRIEYMFFDPNYRLRPSVSELLTHL